MHVQMNAKFFGDNTGISSIVSKTRCMLIEKFLIESLVPGTNEWWEKVELALWHYVDEVLPRIKDERLDILRHIKYAHHLRHMGEFLFPSPGEYDHINLSASAKAYDIYKKSLDVAGCILLSNEAIPRILMIRPKRCAAWTMPKGKAKKGESMWQTATRETFEEVGYQVEKSHTNYKCIELKHRRSKCTLYVIPGVPSNFKFQTFTRGEVDEIGWKSLTNPPLLCTLAQRYIATLNINSRPAFLRRRIEVLRI